MLSMHLLSRLRPLTETVCTARQISIDKLSNKKITRLESNVELDDCEFKSRLINRNPRNLEQMSYEKKPTGFWLDNSPRAEWNKLVFKQANGHLYAYLRHWSGKNILESSTEEPQLAKYFKNPSTLEAATILGQVMSRRCLQSGYLYAAAEIPKGVKSEAFFCAMSSNGFLLEEPPEIEPRLPTDL